MSSNYPPGVTGNEPEINGIGTEIYDRATEEMFKELMRAKGLFPDHFANQHEGIAVIHEEFIELRTEVYMNQKDYRRDAQRKEALQLAAMAIRFAAELT